MTITKNNFSTLQQRNVEFARTWMTGGIEVARAYQNLFSPFSYAIYTQQSLKAAQQTTQLTQQALQAAEQALKATRQELRVAQEAAAKAEKDTAKAEKAAAKAEQTNAKNQEAIREATLRAEEEAREAALQTAAHNSLKQELRVAQEAAAKAEKAAAQAEKDTAQAEKDTAKAEKTAAKAEQANAKNQEAIREATPRAEKETREAALQTAVHNSLKTKDYEELNVDEVAKRLDGLSAAELEKVREYEKHNKNRDALVKQIDRKMKATA